MKSKSFFTFCILLLFMAFNIDAQVASVRDSLGGAPVPPEIENPECTGINKEPAHATLMPYADLPRRLLPAGMHHPCIKALTGPGNSTGSPGHRHGLSIFTKQHMMFHHGKRSLFHPTGSCLATGHLITGILAILSRRIFQK